MSSADSLIHFRKTDYSKATSIMPCLQAIKKPLTGLSSSLHAVKY